MGDLIRVDLKKWMNLNKPYVIAWILMGLATLGLIIYELRATTFFLILPFLPYLVLALVRMRQELRK